MKAVTCHAFGPYRDLRLEEVDPAEPGPGEVRIDVRACGVNFYDGLAVAGEYQTRPELPFSPGGEVAGTIGAVGEAVDEFHVGQRVLAFTGFGGYAQSVVAPASQVFPAGETLDLEKAAGFLIAYATSYHALKDRAALQPGQTLLVLGAAGGVGLAAVELGKLMGATVIAAASSHDKLELCRQYGADHTINYAETDLREAVASLTGKRGVDVVYDPVGGEQSEKALRSLALGGRLLVIGFASGTIPEIKFNRLLLKQISVTGVLWGAWSKAEPVRNAANMRELLAFHEEGKLQPHVSEIFPLERYEDALDRVMGKAAKGKVVLRVDPMENSQKGAQ